MNDCKTQATTYLAEFFKSALFESNLSMHDFEDYVCVQGTKILAQAANRALEMLDDALYAQCAQDLRARERRVRTLASTVGDLKFSRRIYEDKYKNSTPLIDEVLDIPYRAKISPLAREFLVHMASKVSYQESVNILAARGGSTVSASSVMRLMHQVGHDCKAQDITDAQSLYCDGVLPDNTTCTNELFVEADGTYVPLQNGKKAEIKALVAYSGKTSGNRPERIDPCRFGCVGTKDEFWTQGFSAIAQNFDITKVDKVHMGFDGEPTYKQAQKYFLMNAEFDGNLDPYHLNRAVRLCFDEGGCEYNQVMSALWYKNPYDAASMLEYYAQIGVASEKNAEVVAKYIRNNAEFIKTNDFTLGTMECEQEHMYKSCLAALPCAWSVEGIDAMARIRSRMHSRRRLVFRNREQSIPKEVMRRRERKVAKYLESRPRVFQKTVGSGYNYPHQAQINSKVKSGLISAWSENLRVLEECDPY